MKICLELVSYNSCKHIWSKFEKLKVQCKIEHYHGINFPYLVYTETRKKVICSIILLLTFVTQ